MSNTWKKLDNAAKIFPSAVNKSDTQVFRIVFELKQPIDSAVLQQALDETLDVFELYKSVMRRGIFWYYLDPSDIKAIVHEEKKAPCRPIYVKGKKKLLFDVSYYGNRINLEMSHVLSDGTGALNFMSALVTSYLAKIQNKQEPTSFYDASRSQMADDSFYHYYEREKGRNIEKNKRACSLRGAKYEENRLKIICGKMSASDVLKLAREEKTSITVLFAALMIEAIGNYVSLADKKRRPVILAVPVNLRNHFPSESARNFFSALYIGYDFSKGDGSRADIIGKVAEQLKEKLKKENLAHIMNGYSTVEHNFFIRIAPLLLKNITLKTAYRLNSKKSTAGLSNVGVIKLPDDMAELVDGAYIFSGTADMQACVCTVGDNLTVSFSSPFISSDIQRGFFRALTEKGVNVEITANLIGGEEKTEA